MNPRNFFAELKRRNVYNEIWTADYADLHGLREHVFNS
jgi:hypothetical protein